MNEARTFCRICGAACGLVIETDGVEVVRVRGDADDPISHGYTCAKGRALGALHHHPRRLDEPMVRETGQLVPTSWEACLDDLAAALAAVRDERGPDAVAFYSATASSFDSIGGRYSAVFAAAFGSRNRYSAITIDSACKPLVAELMGGRADLLPTIDLEHATLSVFIGCNPLVSHGHYNTFPDPVTRLRQLATDGRELWVIDPRRSETARLATRHLQPIPGTDWALLAHAVRELLRDGADLEFLREHAEGVEDLRAAVEPYTGEVATARTGLTADEIADFVAALRRHRRVAAQTGTGTTMSRPANVTEWLTCALHVVTGSYDREGGMWFNPGFLSCHDRRSPEPGPGSATAPGPPSRPDLPSRMGEYPCAALVDQIESGAVAALVVLGGNPATAFPNPARLTAAVATLDVLAVGDILRSDTAELATHLLPCTGQLERADMPYFLDQFLPELSTRYTPAVLAPVAKRRSAWWIFDQLGRRLGLPVLPEDVDPDAVSEEELLRRFASRGRLPFDEIRDARVVVDPESPTFGWAEASLPDGRWRVAPEALVEQLRALGTSERESADLVVVPRRQMRHMNSLLRDATAPGGTPDAPDVLVHPDDAARRGIGDGDTVVLQNDTGVFVGVARVDDGIRQGVLSVPHGWPGDAHVGNLLTGATRCDPLTGMVRQSGVPVTLSPRA